MDVLLYAPEYRPNLSNMIRTTEFFGFDRIYIYDSNGLLDPPNNKVSRADMNHLARVWTAGAIEHIEIVKVADMESFLADYPGRKVATYVDPAVPSLREFQFQREDLLIMGPEKEGLPKSVAELCEVQLYITGFGETNCLNVSVSLGIFLHNASMNLAIMP